MRIRNVVLAIPLVWLGLMGGGAPSWTDGMQTSRAHADSMPTGHSHAMVHEHAAGHDHSRQVEMPAGMPAPTVDIAVAPDPVGGWNLHVVTQNFRFAPEHASGAHTPGEGHAHLYAGGKKIARLYGPWFHIAELPAGDNELTVTLNTNDHAVYAADGKPVSATTHVTAAATH